MNQSSHIIIKSSSNGISRIILNDPKTYNSLSSKMIKLLISAFNKLENDKKTKVIIIESSGKGFSAGHNLKEISSFKRNTFLRGCIKFTK